MKERLAELKLEPLSRDDIVIVLSNPFAERCGLLLDYALKEIGMEEASLEKLIKEVAFRSLEEPSKVRPALHHSTAVLFT